jgi:hypothetical protein
MVSPLADLLYYRMGAATNIQIYSRLTWLYEIVTIGLAVSDTTNMGGVVGNKNCYCAKLFFVPVSACSSHLLGNSCTMAMEADIPYQLMMSTPVGALEKIIFTLPAVGDPGRYKKQMCAGYWLVLHIFYCKNNIVNTKKA